jgi:hypothetical protein
MTSIMDLHAMSRAIHGRHCARKNGDNIAECHCMDNGMLECPVDILHGSRELPTGYVTCLHCGGWARKVGQRHLTCNDCGHLEVRYD